VEKWLGPSQAREQAMDLFQKAFELQMHGSLCAAIDLYERSVELWPTAEAYTFMGWAHSHLGRYDAAISFCRQAIELDPDFGNPYNDIGAYLIELGHLREAVPWLEKAIRAPRYECVHYAWHNLGRIHEELGDHQLAKKCYLKSLETCPEYPLARTALFRLVGSMN
jgi:tetratricopeptide (TPR) repeat protein